MDDDLRQVQERGITESVANDSAARRNFVDNFFPKRCTKTLISEFSKSLLNESNPISSAGLVAHDHDIDSPSTLNPPVYDEGNSGVLSRSFRSSSLLRVPNRKRYNSSPHEYWINRFNTLLEHCETVEGICDLPLDFVMRSKSGEAVRLGMWLKVQKGKYSEGKLDGSKKALIDGLIRKGKLLWQLYEEPSTVMEEEQTWNRMFQLLQELGKRFGGWTCNVDLRRQELSQSADHNEFAGVCSWLECQRVLKRRGQLRPHRLRLLQGLVDDGLLSWQGPNCDQFLWEDDDLWDQTYDNLIRYGQGHFGDCNVPDTFSFTLDDGSELRLGEWLFRQREYRKNGLLNTDRQAKLQRLVDGGWLSWSSVESIESTKWNYAYFALILFVEEFGHGRIPPDYVKLLSDGVEVMLGKWCEKQKEDYEAGALCADRAKRLSVLVSRHILDWMDVSASKSEPNASCGDDSSDEEHSGLKEAAPLDVRESPRGRWNLYYSCLLKYSEEHGGSCNVHYNHKYPLTDGTELQLGAWLNSQRQYKTKNTLREDRQQRLQLLVDQGRLSWTASYYRDRWHEKFQALLTYGEGHKGNCNVPQSYITILPDGQKCRLGQWLARLRRDVRDDLLNDERLKKVMDLVEGGNINI